MNTFTYIWICDHSVCVILHYPTYLHTVFCFLLLHWHRRDYFVWFEMCQKSMTRSVPRVSCSMEQSPSWEANRFLASQEIPHILWNPNVHKCIQKCPPPVPTLSQHDPVHALTSHFLKINLHFILPSVPGSSKWFLSLVFPHHIPEYTSILTHTCYIPCPPLYSLFDHLHNIGWGVQIMKLLFI